MLTISNAQHILPQKISTKEEHICQCDVNALKYVLDYSVDRRSTISIILINLVQKYNLQTTKEKSGILAKQTKDSLTL